MRVASLVAGLAVSLIGPPAIAAPGLPLVEGPDVAALTELEAVVTAFEDERFECTGSPRTATIDVPQSAWDRVILEVEIVQDGDPWDRLFGVAIAGVEVIRGTTPRTDFTVHRDITTYGGLLPPGGTADVSLRLDSYVGAMLGSVRLLFHTGEPTGPLFSQSFEAVPVVTWGSLTGAGASLERTIDLGSQPPDAAQVELTTTGHSSEEFWYLGSPVPRTFRVYVDDEEVASFVAMPYVYALVGFGNENANTACVGPGTSAFGDTVHPVMWWSAHRAANAAGVHTGNGEIPPYRATIDPQLLTGVRDVRIVQSNGGQYWVTSVALLLYR